MKCCVVTLTFNMPTICIGGLAKIKLAKDCPSAIAVDPAGPQTRDSVIQCAVNHDMSPFISLSICTQGATYLNFIAKSVMMVGTEANPFENLDLVPNIVLRNFTVCHCRNLGVRFNSLLAKFHS